MWTISPLTVVKFEALLDLLENKQKNVIVVNDKPTDYPELDRLIKLTSKIIRKESHQ